MGCRQILKLLTTTRPLILPFTTHSYESEISKDYRLNYRLRTACKDDIQGLCPAVCQHNDGQVGTLLG